MYAWVYPLLDITQRLILLPVYLSRPVNFQEDQQGLQWRRTNGPVDLVDIYKVKIGKPVDFLYM